MRARKTLNPAAASASRTASRRPAARAPGGAQTAATPRPPGPQGFAAPPAALATAFDTSIPALLPVGRPVRARHTLLFECWRRTLPEGMADRVILLPEDSDEPGADLTLSLAVLPGEDDPRRVHLVVRTVAPDDMSSNAVAEAAEARVRALAPLAGTELVRRPLKRPRWDDDDCLEDPGSGRGWPGEVDIRLSQRPQVYFLDRAAVGGLGLEGELLLGWHGGDAIAAEL